MTRHNTLYSYGSVTRLFHWLTALLILTLIPLGVLANRFAHQITAPGFDGDSALIDRTVFLFSLHKTLGITVFVVAVLRILWALTQEKPGPLHPQRKAETFLAGLVHWLLYASLIVVPLSGWVTHAASEGFAPIWWPLGQGLPLVPQSAAVHDIAANLHIIFERVLVVSLLLHVAGALKHHFLDRDGTLTRMLRGDDAGVGTPHHVGAAPLAAVGVYAIALGIGAGLGMLSPKESTAAPALAEVSSDWTVTEGAIDIQITQLGSDVSGSFANWTSDITFDPSISEGIAGSVETFVAIGSLSLGTVTSQAMGADFFAVDTHPNAIYRGDIIASADGYVTTGTLILKGVELPVSFPFTLEVVDGVARMTGTLTLNRADFGIGASTDTGSLANEVIVTLTVTATRSAE